MAKIETYQRRQSESSAVGTPGVDLSGAKIAETVGGVAEIALKAKIEKRKVIDTAEANRRLVDFDMEAEQISQTVQQEFAGKNPDEQMSEVKNRLSKRMEELGQGFNSPEAKRDFNTSAYKIVGNRSLKAFEAANKRQTSQAGQNVVTSLNTLANSMSGVFADKNLSLEEKMGELTNKIELAQKVVDSSSSIYDPREFKKLRQSVPEMLAKGAVLGAMQSDPDLAISLLDSGEFDEQLTPEEKDKFYSKAKTIKERMGKAAEEAQKEAYQENLVSTANSFLSGNLTLASLEESVTSGDLDPKAAAAFELALFNPKEWKRVKNEKTSTQSQGRILVRIINSLGDDEPVGDVVLRAVDEHNRGELDFRDLAWVIKAANEKKKDSSNPQWDYLIQAISSVQSFMGPIGVPKLVHSISEGEDPREVAKDLIKSNAKVRNPKLSVMDEIPNSVMDAFGLVKRIWLGEEIMPEDRASAPQKDSDAGTE